MSGPVNLDWLRAQAHADQAGPPGSDGDPYTLGVLALLDAYGIVRDELYEAAMDHDPPSLMDHQRRAWCSACDNWTPYNCTAARALKAIAKADALVGVPEGQAPLPSCKHATYTSGCDSCDWRDPEEADALVTPESVSELAPSRDA